MRNRSVYPLRYLLGVGLPGAVWLTLFVAVAIYALFAIALGRLDPILFQPVPAWNPLHWSFTNFSQVLSGLNPAGGDFWGVFIRSIVYIALGAAGCVLVGYPVAYFIALR